MIYPSVRDFPFPSFLGDCVVVAHTHLEFRQLFGVSAEGWGPNYAQACSQLCSHWETEEDYDLAVSALRKAFADWEGGIYLPDFKPEPYGAKKGKQAQQQGVEIFPSPGSPHHYSRIWIPDTIAGATSPGAFFAIAKDILAPAHALDYQLAPIHQPSMRKEGQLAA
ncbi:MAG: hypothetical protein RIR97_1803 [Pseudomonadota bacterium]